MAQVSSKTYNIKTADFAVITDTRLLFNGIFLRDIDEEQKRIENLGNHIEADDYFGSLATIIDLVRQELKTTNQELRETLHNLKDDLLYLQEKYKIVKK